MRVTLVSPFDPMPSAAAGAEAHWGGVEQVLLQVSRGLVRQGHEVSVVCSTAGEPGNGEEEGVDVVRIRRKGTLWRTPLVDLASHVPATSDIVQVPATYPLTTESVLKRAKALDIPCVLDFHFEPSPDARLARVAASCYSRWIPSRYRWADIVLLRSLEYGRSARSLRNVPPERLRVLPNGIDAGRYCLDGKGHDGDYLLFVGRLIPYKGLEVLLRSLSRYPVPLPLFIVGDGPLRSRLEALAKRLGVNAHFLGHVNDDRLPGLYRGARATVLPSVNGQEAFGITLVESMACGTPVVASDLPGVREVACEGGITVPPGDPDALGLALRDAVEPGWLPRGADLSRKVQKTYSWDSITRRLSGFYQEVLAARSTRPGGLEHAHLVRDPVL